MVDDESEAVGKEVLEHDVELVFGGSRRDFGGDVEHRLRRAHPGGRDHLIVGDAVSARDQVPEAHVFAGEHAWVGRAGTAVAAYTNHYATARGRGFDGCDFKGQLFGRLRGCREGG